MTNKAFSLLLLFTLVFGGALGAAFAAGVALGKSQGPDPSQDTASFSPPRSFGDGESSSGGFQGGRSRSGGFQGRQPGADAGGREGGFPSGSRERSAGPEGIAGAEGRQSIIGTIGHFEDSLVTLNTLQGQVQVSLAESTTIQTTSQGTVADLVEGASVGIIGRRDQEGNIQARAVTLLLESPVEVTDLTGGTGENGHPEESFARRGNFGWPTPVSGTIESVEDGLVIVSGPNGQVKVTLLADTTIQKTTLGTKADLVEGVRVRVSGRTGETGDLVAESLMVIPGDAEGFFGRRGDRGRQ